MLEPSRSDRLLRPTLHDGRQQAVGIDLAGSRVWMNSDLDGSAVLPAVVYALEVSRYQQTSLVLELTRLDGRLRHVFGEITRQEPTEERISDLVGLYRDRAQLCQWVRSLLAPGVCFGLGPYHEDEQFREHLASRLSLLSGVDDSEAVYRTFDALRDLQAAVDVADEIWTEFARIDTAASERGVQVAVRALLNDPSNRSRSEACGTEDVSERLRRKVERAANVLTGIPAPQQWTTRDLYTEVHRKVWDTEREQSGTADGQIRASARTLVTRPRNLEQATGSPELAGHPGGISVRGWALYRLFRAARYGGVIYPHSSTESSHLVNPWVDASTDDGTTAYREEWREALFSDALLERVFEQVNQGTKRRPLRCPLCDVSVAQCGGETCERRATVARLNRQLHELVSRLRAAGYSG